MDKAQISETSLGQVVRLPQKHPFAASEVIGQHFGGAVFLLSKNSLFTFISTSLVSFERGLQLTREQPGQQEPPELAS